MTIKRIYMCANAWLSFIKKEDGRYQQIEQTLNAAKNGECEVWTSIINVAEVYKSDAIGEAAAASDKMIDDLLGQNYVKRVAVDLMIAQDARNLLRKYRPPLKKPFDAIHLATALKYNCDVLYTFDRDDLLGLNGKTVRADGVKLIIKKPTLEVGPLFDEKDQSGGEEDAKTPGKETGH